MKRILALGLIALTLTLTSCDNTPIKVANPDKVTTVELQNIAKADTNEYKVVYYFSPGGGETMFIINPKIDKVVMKVDNNSGAIDTLALVVLMGFLLALILGLILA